MKWFKTFGAVIILSAFFACTYNIYEYRNYALDIYCDDNSTVSLDIPIMPQIKRTQDWSAEPDVDMSLTGLPY